MLGSPSSRILHATHATRGSLQNAPTIVSSHVGDSRTSLLSSATSSPLAASSPRLAARAKPLLYASSTTRTRGWSQRRYSNEPSVEPLSTTTTSSGARVCSATEARQPSSQRRPFQFGMTTETAGRSLWLSSANLPRSARAGAHPRTFPAGGFRDPSQQRRAEALLPARAPVHRSAACAPLVVGRRVDRLQHPGFDRLDGRLDRDQVRGDRGERGGGLVLERVGDGQHPRRRHLQRDQARMRRVHQREANVVFAQKLAIVALIAAGQQRER